MMLLIIRVVVNLLKANHLTWEVTVKKQGWHNRSPHPQAQQHLPWPDSPSCYFLIIQTIRISHSRKLPLCYCIARHQVVKPNTLSPEFWICRHPITCWRAGDQNQTSNRLRERRQTEARSSEWEGGWTAGAMTAEAALGFPGALEG